MQYLKIVWHIVLGLIVVVAAPQVIAQFIILPGVSSAIELEGNTLRNVRGFLLLVLTSLMYFGFVKFYEKRKAFELMLRWRNMAIASAVGSVMLLIPILLLFAAGYYQVISHNDYREMIYVLFGIAAVAMLEEFVMRGIIFRVFEENIGTIYAVFSISVLFAVGNYFASDLTFVATTTTFLISVVWCGIYVLSRNIWVVGLHHAAWNYTAFSVGILDEHWRVSAPIETLYQGPVFMTGGVLGPEGSIFTVVVCAFAAAFIFHKVPRLPSLEAIIAPGQLVLNMRKT